MEHSDNFWSVYNVSDSVKNAADLITNQAFAAFFLYRAEKIDVNENSSQRIREEINSSIKNTMDSLPTNDLKSLIDIYKAKIEKFDLDIQYKDSVFSTNPFIVNFVLKSIIEPGNKLLSKRLESKRIQNMLNRLKNIASKLYLIEKDEKSTRETIKEAEESTYSEINEIINSMNKDDLKAVSSLCVQELINYECQYREAREKGECYVKLLEENENIREDINSLSIVHNLIIGVLYEIKKPMVKPK